MPFSTLQEGLTGGESDAVLHNFLAAAYFAERRNDAGVASLQKAKELKPDYFTPYYNLASFYALQRDYDKSRAGISGDPRPETGRVARRFFFWH